MKKYLGFFGIFATLLMIMPGAAADQTGAKTDPSLDDQARKAIVDKIGILLIENYVFLDTGQEMADLIHLRLQDGQYERQAKAYIFAGRLTSDLRSVSNDKHLRVTYDPETAAALLQNRRSDVDERGLESMRNQNFGFAKAEILPGNLGYLDLRMFAPLEHARKIAAAAMNSLENSDAVIIDLRHNGGGSPHMVQFLCSYFFGPEPVHLNSLYWRPQNSTEEFWTLNDLPGKRRPDVDLFILTSRRTFSGAEEFTYNMKTRKRAIIVGETTGGGAHPVSLMPVDANLVMSVPVGRAINPVTQSNWEGTGVQPDIQVPESLALIEAQILALKSILGRISGRDSQGRIKNIIRDLESRKKGKSRSGMGGSGLPAYFPPLFGPAGIEPCAGDTIPQSHPRPCVPPPL